MASTCNSNTSEYCGFCFNKHNRSRPSFCQCKHCSIPLCFDCMKQHHDELLQDVEQISHQYNELQQLIQSKQMMIVDETAKSIEDVNRYFAAYIDELHATEKKIIANMENAKQNAQDHVREIDTNLRLIGGEIQGLAKESIVQTAKMQTVSSELKKIEQQLNTYQIIKADNLIQTQPAFSIKFDCPSVDIKTTDSTDMEVNQTCQTNPQVPAPQTSSFGLFRQFPVEQKPLFNLTRNNGEQKPLFNLTSNNDEQKSLFNLTGNNDDKKDNSSSSSTCDDDDDDSASNASHIDTSYDVDRMASDGENILYTIYDDDEPDRIAYCCMDDDSDDEDVYKDWNHSRIVDMIWWSGIGKFVCATKSGIYTVDYARKKFKIRDVIDGKWSYIRVASNATHLFVWTKSNKNDFHGIEVYSTEFESTRKIDFHKHRNESFVNESVSFCVTDNLIALIYPHVQNNRKILEVIFCDMKMKKSNSITLDQCNRNTQIRSNDKDRFFITTGGHSFHIVSSNSLIQTIELQHNGKWIAVLDDKHVAVSNGRSDIQLVPYSTHDCSTLSKPKPTFIFQT